MKLALTPRIGAVLAGGLLAAALLPAAGLATGASVPAGVGGTVHPAPGPGGKALHGTFNQVVTQNWSGYAVANFETHKTYSSASGTWVVPTVTPAGVAPGYSSSWVGIGGYCESTTCTAVDSSLIQLGTDQFVSSTGVVSYSAWYELLPTGPVTIPLTVKAGETVTASLADGPGGSGTGSSPVHGHTSSGPANKPSTHGTHGTHGGGNKGGGSGGGHKGGNKGGGSGQSWTLTMTVGSHSWTTTVSYDSSLLSAEWIEEAPAGCLGPFCTILPLANYGTATFDPGTVDTGVSPDLTATDSIQMLNPNGQTSNPSSPDADADGFATCWGTGSYSSCAAPTS